MNDQDDLIDVCCGQGEPTVVLAELGPTVLGVDISETLIARARVKHRDNSRLSFMVSDAADFSMWPDSRFSVATCINGLFHLSPGEMFKFFEGLKKVVRPHGPILVTSVNPEAYEEFANAFQDRDEIVVPPQPDSPIQLKTKLVIGYPLVAGPGDGQIQLDKMPFYKHPLETHFKTLTNLTFSL